MNILLYTFLITSLLCLNYVICFLVITWAVIVGLFLNYDYLDTLILISNFGFLVGLPFQIFSKLSNRDIHRITKKINPYNVVFGFGTVFFAIMWFDVGIYMDITNQGLSDKGSLQTYFLAYNVALGGFLTGMIENLVSELDRLARQYPPNN